MFANAMSDILPEEVEQFLAQSSESLAQGMHLLFEALESHPQVTTLFYVFNSIIIFMYLHSQQQHINQLQQELKQMKEHKLSTQNEENERQAKQTAALDRSLTLLDKINADVIALSENQKTSLDLLRRNILANHEVTKQIEVRTDRTFEKVEVRTDRILEKLAQIHEALYEEVNTGIESLSISEQSSYLPSSAPQVKDTSAGEHNLFTASDLGTVPKVSPS